MARKNLTKFLEEGWGCGMSSDEAYVITPENHVLRIHYATNKVEIMNFKERKPISPETIQDALQFAKYYAKNNS